MGEEEVRRALRKVNPNKAAGPDNVTPRVLKGCAVQLTSILSYMFNFSLMLCDVPEPLENVLYCSRAEKKVVTEMNDL